MPKSTAAFTVLFLLSLFFASHASSTGAVVDPKKTVYETLSAFGLPPGLLPDSVVSYSLSKNGSFVVELAAPCYVQFEYLVYYEKTISGTLKIGGIFDLEGVQVKKLLFWLSVDSIQVDLPPVDSIYFEIGWISKKLDVEQLHPSHQIVGKVYLNCLYCNLASKFAVDRGEVSEAKRATKQAA